MKSTMFNRTMQSGYSELMGFNPPSDQANATLTAKQIGALNEGKSATLPFSVSNASAIQQEVGQTALPDGFVGIPIYNYINKPLSDDLDFESCGYVRSVDSARWPNEETYRSVDYLIDELQPVFNETFGLNQTESTRMTFMGSDGIWSYCDWIQSDLFEFEYYREAMDSNYTQDQLSEINQTVLATLDLPLSDPINSRNLFVSKQLREPINLMNATILNATKGFYPLGVDQTKFLMYSTHDFTVAQSWLFMNASNGNYTNVPFASQFVLELHSTEDCKNQSCFWVEMYANGDILKFDNECLQPDKCTYDEFMALLESRGFISSDTDYRDECDWKYEQPIPPSETSSK